METAITEYHAKILKKADNVEQLYTRNVCIKTAENALMPNNDKELLNASTEQKWTIIMQNN
jgi:hypothetical protein